MSRADRPELAEEPLALSARGRVRGDAARLRAVLRFPVGAAALVDDGRTVAGCNVENAAYGVTLCAECGLVSAAAPDRRRPADALRLRRRAGRRADALWSLPAAALGERRARRCGCGRSPAVVRHDRGAARRVRARQPAESQPMAEQHDAVEVISPKRDGGTLSRQPDRLGDRRLHARRRRRRADVGAGDGDPAQRHGPARDRPLDRRDDRVGGADGLLRAVAAAPPTSTRPAASATRSRCRWPRWWRRAASRSPS